MNYVIALVLGLLLPMLLITALFLLNTNITDPKDITFLSRIPLLGVIGKSNEVLAVFKRSKSPVSESFRSMRSNLEFIYKKQDIISTARTLLVTSSVSGEGKSFTAINLACMYAMSNKKTVLVGLDLRKPKIFDDFELHNNYG